MKTGHLNLPIIKAEESLNVGNQYQTRLSATYFSASKTHPLAIKKKDAFESDIRIKALEGKLLSTGSGGTRFEIYKLVTWWLWYANTHGIEKADQFLNKFLEEEKIKCWLVLWVHGVKPSEAIQLTDQVRIIPVAEMPDSAEKEQVLYSIFQVGAGTKSVPSAALVYEANTNKLYDSSKDSLEDIFALQQVLHRIAILLNALPNVVCTGGFLTSYVPENIPIGPFGGGGGGIPVLDVWPTQQITTFSNDSIADLRKLNEGFCDLSSAWKERLIKSLERLRQAKCRVDINDQALDLGIALEMALLNSENNNAALPGQLHNHFRLRGAWLIGHDFHERQKIYKMLGTIYSQRSQVAHNGFLTPPKNGQWQKYRNEVKKHFALGEKILFELITNGPPTDWNNLVLGENI